MTDLQIIEAVLMGHHLNSEELEKAKQLIHKMNIYIKQQKA